jgi:ribosomal protein S18 acetylase RimI-like enzyme
MTPHSYPDDPVSGFRAPPATTTDDEDREISVAVAVEGDGDRLVEMYADFDPADRAQGIPPARESAIQTWLERVLTDDAVNVVAWHDDQPVGHAMLVPDDQGDYELAIFVLGAYQSAGIGSFLLETLLGHAQELGIERVWLTVERWNDAAIHLYKSIGFETTDAESFELEMGIRLADD